jgi:hypothetical protein
MSRRKLRLDPATAATIKRAARCPDCHSHVKIRANGDGPGMHRVEVGHDDSCPLLPTLGGHRQVALVARPDQTDAEFAKMAAEFTREFTAAFGAVYVSNGFYVGARPAGTR